MYLVLPDINSYDTGYTPSDMAGANGRELHYKDKIYTCTEMTWTQNSTVHSVSGTVSYGDGGTVAGARVSLGAPGLYTAFTGESGGYTISDIPSGNTYAVTVSKTGYHQTDEVSVTMSGDISASGISLEINRHTIRGSTYIVEGEEWVTTSDVSVSFVSGDTYGPVTTDSDGYYEITGVPYLTYGNIIATIPGYHQIEIFSLTVDEDCWVSVDLEINTYTVSGKLTVTGGASEENVTVTLTSSSGPEYTAVTDSNGDYEITEVPHFTSGDITAEIEGYTQTGSPDSIVSLTGDLDEQDIVLTALYTVSGTLTVNGSASPEDASVSLISASDQTEYPGTVSGSTYTILNVLHGTSGDITAEIEGCTQTGSPDSIVSLTGDLDEQDIVLTALYTVTLTKEGRGVSGYKYSINSSDDTDYDGSFEIEHGSTLEVTALFAEGYEFKEWSGSDSETNPLTVSVTEDTSLTASGELTKHTVTFDSGQDYTVYTNGGPLSSSMVTVTYGSSLLFGIQAPEGYSASPSVISGTADITLQADGRYKMSNIRSDVRISITVNTVSGDGSYGNSNGTDNGGIGTGTGNGTDSSGSEGNGSGTDSGSSTSYWAPAVIIAVFLSGIAAIAAVKFGLFGIKLFGK
jgi:hypothetical protein